MRTKTVTGLTIELDLHLSDLLLNVMASLSNGSVSITGLPEEVTTITSPDMLGISPPTLLNRIAANKNSGRRFSNRVAHRGCPWAARE